MKTVITNGKLILEDRMLEGFDIVLEAGVIQKIALRNRLIKGMRRCMMPKMTM